MVSSPKHVCSIHKVTTKEIHALPSWVKAEAGNLYVVKICMDKKKKTQKMPEILRRRYGILMVIMKYSQLCVPTEMSFLTNAYLYMKYALLPFFPVSAYLQTVVEGICTQ